MLFEGIDMDLAPGETVTIEAPSGSGKSTLLAILGGLLKPVHGTVQWTGDRSQPVAWVLQTFNVLGSRTVLDNTCVLERLDGRRYRQSRAHACDVLELVGLTPLAHIKAQGISGGEQQRVAVARALVSRRPLLLADEPTNQLDKESAHRVMDALSTAASRGRTVVIVTHDHDSVPSTARRLRLTERGLESLS